MSDVNSSIGSFLRESGIPYEENVSLSGKTWIRRGGLAHFYVVPDTVAQLEDLCRFLFGERVEFVVVGHTSNMYFVNDCDVDVVISTLHLSQIVEEDASLVCDCGVNVTALSRRMVEAGIAGFEGLVGLPGTIGGAVVNNSSAFGYSINKLATEIICLNDSGTVVNLSVDDLSLSERSSAIKEKLKKLVVLKVRLRKEKSSDASLSEKASCFVKKRAELQKEKKMNLGSCYKMLRGGLLLKALLTVRFVSRLCIRVFCPKSVQKKMYERKLFYWLAGYPQLYYYVDPFQPNCFVWRDEAADDVFFNQYQPFMKRFYRAKDLEIEIIK